MKILLSLAATCVLSGVTAMAQNPQITSVVETGGDNEATDTIPAKWTGQTFPVSIAAEPLPTSVIGETYTVETFGDRVPAFVDRNHRYLNSSSIGAEPPVDLPAYLVGNPYIMSGNDNRDNAGYLLRVTVDKAARVYMLIDNRLSDLAGGDPPTFGPGAMQWIPDEGWEPMLTGSNRAGDQNIPDEIAFDEGANDTIEQWYSVYFKDVVAGTFTLRQADNATRNMYGVVVGPLPPPSDPIQIFTAQPPAVAYGGQVRLEWLIATDATSAEIDNGVGNILPLTASGAGFTTVSPTETTTYTMTVNTPGGSETAPLGVVVQTLASFTASSTSIPIGGSATLNWSVYPGSTVSIEGIGDVTNLTDASGAGSLQVSPSSPTLYTMTAVRGAVTETASVGIGLVPPALRYALLDIGATDGIPEPGATGGAVLGAGVNNTNGTDLFAAPLVSDTGDEFTVSIEAIDPDGFVVGGLDWRDRGDAPNVPMGHLGEDHVKNNQGVIRVTLGSLPAGEFSVVSYHMDATFSQSEEIRILVNDAISGGTVRDTGVIADASYPGHPDNTGAVPVAGLGAFTVGQKAVTFSIVSDGINDVAIYFDSRSAPVDMEVPLSGLLLLPPRTVAGVEITSIRYTPGAVTDTVALEFTSQPDQNYRIQESTDLQNWSVLEPSVPGRAGEATTLFEASGIPKAPGKRFFRVQRL